MRVIKQGRIFLVSVKLISYILQPKCVMSLAIEFCHVFFFLIHSSGNPDVIYQNWSGTHTQNGMFEFPLSQPCNTSD